MGVKISIDKHVSELEDILEMSPHYLSRVQFDSKISPDITQHLKVRNHFNYFYNVIFSKFWTLNLNFLFQINRSGDFMNLKRITIMLSRHRYRFIIWRTISFIFLLKKPIWSFWFIKQALSPQVALPIFRIHFGVL